MDTFSPIFTRKYDPLRAGSIDGTDDYPHDKAIFRAMNATYKPNKYVKGNPECTVFVGRLSPNTSEETVRSSLREFGKICNVRIVRDIVTGFSKCYGFVEFLDKHDADSACRKGSRMVIDDHEVLIDFEKERSLKGWIPRRLGGGIGGKRESGQLRFGGKERPFKRPIHSLDQGERNRRNTDDRRERSQNSRDDRKRFREDNRDRYRR